MKKPIYSGLSDMERYSTEVLRDRRPGAEKSCSQTYTGKRMFRSVGGNICVLGGGVLFCGSCFFFRRSGLICLGFFYGFVKQVLCSDYELSAIAKHLCR